MELEDRPRSGKCAMPKLGFGTDAVSLLLPTLALAGCLVVKAQTPIHGMAPGGAVRMVPTDWSILETQEPRKDLPCSVTPVKPVVGFDLRFHAGYEVAIPLKELAGADNLLTMIFRVTPGNRKDDASYFVQRVRVPSIDPEASGDAFLEGAFDLGEGKYHVDWLMRDRAERVCSSYWDTDAELTVRDKGLNLTLEPEAVRASDTEPFKEEPPVERAQGQPPLNVKILVNFAPQNAHSAALPAIDQTALVSILRGISREPQIGRFSVVAFNLQQQKILYRQQDENRIDFPALGQALETMHLGTVDIKSLKTKNGETEFLSTLIQQELKGEGHPDALIFAGPKALLEENVSRDSLKEVGEVEYPVFYMNYNLQPQSMPWRDAIGSAVKFFRGYEFTISRPRDLWSAMTDMVSKIVKFRSTRRTAGLGSH
jgi:hypothetical protein